MGEWGCIFLSKSNSVLTFFYFCWCVSNITLVWTDVEIKYWLIDWLRQLRVSFFPDLGFWCDKIVKLCPFLVPFLLIFSWKWQLAISSWNPYLLLFLSCRASLRFSASSRPRFFVSIDSFRPQLVCLRPSKSLAPKLDPICSQCPWFHQSVSLLLFLFVFDGFAAGIFSAPWVQIPFGSRIVRLCKCYKRSGEHPQHLTHTYSW